MRAQEVVERYLRAVTDPSLPEGTLEGLLHADYTFREWPNALNPAGSERHRETSLRSVARGRRLLARQAFEVHCHVVQGDVVASRMTWRGHLAVDAGSLPAGTELTAHVSQHTTVRDGQVSRAETFDCYEPLGPPTP
jgi:ketosteroid isomerase-like protein